MLDLLLVNGRIHTGDPLHPDATQLGIAAGAVVGVDDEVAGLRAHRVVDLRGLVVVPGLRDAHFHLSALGQHLRRCDVSPESVSTLDELYAAVGRHAATVAPDAWVVAEGYEDARLGGMPQRAALDAVSGGRPVWVVHASHHAGVASSEALRRMGFEDARDVPDVPGGFVERDAEGAATGYLAETAMRLATDALRPEPFEDYVSAIHAGSQAALAMGLTHVTEPGVGGRITGNGPTDIAAFQSARDRGLLGVRATVMPEVGALRDGALDLGIRTGLGDDRLRIGGVKVFADGAFTARTAAVHHCYAEAAGGGEGLLLQEPEQLAADVLAAHMAGWRVCTHAIGDRAVDLVLDAYAAAQRALPRPDARHRIEHCGLVSESSIARMAELGVVPVPQARFVAEFGDTYLQVLGEERGSRVFPQRSFLDAGLELPGSSDAPVVDGEPLLGMQALVERRTPLGRVLAPEERLTPEQALRAFTHGSAYAEHQEHRVGTLRRGMLADLVLLDGDPLDAPEIGAIPVVATVVGGEFAFGDPPG